MILYETIIEYIVYIYIFRLMKYKHCLDTFIWMYIDSHCVDDVGAYP